MDLETDPRDIESLKQLAQGCGRLLDVMFQEENARESDLDAEKGYWASRQFAEFNMWCTKIGVNDQGSRSIDVRLKDVPDICNIIAKLLHSLSRDLEKLQQPFVETKVSINTEIDVNDAYSDVSSESFDSLSSLEHTEVENAIGEAGSENEQVLCLQKHIEDTMDRLHCHALHIEKVGLTHRQNRIRIYQQKETPKFAFEGFNRIGYHKAKAKFPSATDAFHQRIAESFVRRRMRFDYLRMHRKKKAIEAIKAQQMLPIHPRPDTDHQDGDLQSVEPRTQDTPQNVEDITQLYQEDQQTIYPATVNTKLEIHPETKSQERADSVVSIALRHPCFPPPPQFTSASFQCPYCRLVFRAAEAEKANWSQHVMQDFEPYFCILEECKAPFDVPNTFDGLLRHLQDHVEERFHVDLSNGEHKIFDEMEFEEYCTQQGNIFARNRSILKIAARRKGAFILEKCPFCGGYPDVLEKRYPDSNDPEAQIELRHHIKQHMQDIALFLPPYREDVLSKDDDLPVSVLSGERTSTSSFSELEHFVKVCERESCDCKNDGRYAEELGELPERSRPEHDDTDFWATLFPEALRYDNTSLTEESCLKDKNLRHLYTEKLRLTPKVEAAGSTNAITCPVIRGISDYADLHKDREWQSFASMNGRGVRSRPSASDTTQ
ncbi:C2H2 type zinc finger domain protein [Colletotrichum truncatum]|uniref:C2H2 type zinc finger domain protein n=1 Tax=Colletotrichum truncatum TaxID=5467 RepID=A0ACC3YWW5_COLTU|nr:C2H2 type zinc finger domain protein [Colletotrichum truncatum]KAF6787531.1 C2H2 type zinc finger domain protein [Colletotrichum truncatum]